MLFLKPGESQVSLHWPDFSAQTGNTVRAISFHEMCRMLKTQCSRAGQLWKRVDWTGASAQSRLENLSLYFVHSHSATASTVHLADETRRCARPRWCLPHPGGDSGSLNAHRENRDSCPACPSSGNGFKHIYPKLFEIGFYYSFTTLENFNNLYIFTLATEIFCHWCFH